MSWNQTSQDCCLGRHGPLFWGTTSNVDGEVSEHDAEPEKLGKKQFDMDTMHVFERKCFTMATDALKKVIEFRTLVSVENQLEK